MLFHLQEGYYLFRGTKGKITSKKANIMLYFQNQVQFSRTSTLKRVSDDFTESKTQYHEVVWVKRDPWPNPHSLGVISTALEPDKIHLHSLYILKSSIIWLWKVSVQFQELSRLPSQCEMVLSPGRWLVSKETPKWSEETSECSSILVTNKFH